jgi:hypothetical protein
MRVNKYATDNVTIPGGRTVDVSNRVFVPTENAFGRFRTADGKVYRRDEKTGQIRRVRDA